METPSKFFAAPPSGPFDSASHPPDDWRRARAVHTELLLLGMPRVNLLLVGSDAVIRNLLQTLDLRQPVMSWRAGQQLVLPPVGRSKTLVLHDVGALPIVDQLRLLDWLEGAVGRTQVISSTPAPLLARVRSGEFLDTLYYRLNTVCLDVSA